MRQSHFLNFIRIVWRRLHFTSSVAIMLSLVLLINSCAPFPQTPSARQRAEKVIEHLETVSDDLERETASVITLNALCTLSRAASGSAEGELELAIADYFATKDSDISNEIQNTAETLKQISTSERANLLGRFSDFDPSDCMAAPDWNAISKGIIYSHQLVPRLRANYCGGNLVYDDGTDADRVITVGSKVVSPGGIDPGDPSGVAAESSPVVLGIEGESVSARHPALVVTSAHGDGMSPFGVVTDIPCTIADDSGCNANLGLICSEKVQGDFSGIGRCIAYPVVQKDHELILRGYNFWDIDEARLVMTPLIPGEGTESSTIVSFIDANEPISGVDACPIPTPANPTHNRAHFQITANEGNFYKLQMYNHNGNFFTQADTLDHNESRTIHVCYPDSHGEIDVPPDTIRDCTLPVETCAEDGEECSVSWGTPPRQLDECRHLPGEPIVCGETPEWFATEPLTERDGEFTSNKEVVVYVENEEPRYEFRAMLQAVEAEEETGECCFSDEPMLLLAGFPNELPSGSASDLLSDLDENIETWKGGDYDSGNRKSVDQLLSSVDGLTSEDEVIYFLAAAEDDGFLQGFLIGAAVIVAVAAIIYFTGGGGAALLVIIGTATATAIWGAIMESIREDDLIGRATFTATPLNFSERIASTHAADFLTVSPPLFGALPPKDEDADSLSQGELPPRLIHPFAEFSLDDEPLEAVCNPGTCSVGGDICLINRCVAPDFVDTTEGVAFKERREFNDDGHYIFDILWELVVTGP